MSYKTIRGAYDILPQDIEKWHAIEGIVATFCELYGYKEIRTPIIEETKVFKRENDSSDVVNKEMYTFSINGKDSLTLRPEMTAGVVRSFVEHKMYGEGDLPIKLYYIGPQFRYERPQKGRQRIFHQFGVECIGAKDPLLDVETIALAYSILGALGLSQLKVVINTLGDDESRANYKEALKEHFKPALKDLCGDCKRRYEQNPLRILDCKVDHDLDIMASAPKMSDYLNEASKAYFQQVLEGLSSLDIPYEIDDKLVRGLDYYTHTVFELVSTNESMGSQSTVLAGGRYDGLVEYFGGPSLSGIGFAMGIERILIALEGEGIDLNQEASLDAYVLCLDEEASLKCLEIVTILRANGYSAERDYQHRSFKAQFKSVARKKAKFAILIGNTEVQENKVTIKRIEDQKQVSVNFAELISTLDALCQEEESDD